jgi:hypothetical protein
MLHPEKRTWFVMGHMRVDPERINIEALYKVIGTAVGMALISRVVSCIRKYDFNRGSSQEKVQEDSAFRC